MQKSLELCLRVSGEKQEGKVCDESGMFLERSSELGKARRVRGGVAQEPGVGKFGERQGGRR